MEISDKLKQCRTQKDLTQADVADRLNVSRKTVSGWETGRSYPDIKMLVQLGQLYDVSLDVLMNDDETLEHYEQQSQLGNNSLKLFNWSYWMTAILLVLGYVDVFRPGGFHTVIIPVSLLIAYIMMISHYGGWLKFKRARTIISFIAVFVVSFVVTTTLVSFSPEFTRAVSEYNALFNTGFILARLALIFLLSISLSSLIFMRRSECNQV